MRNRNCLLLGALVAAAPLCATADVLVIGNSPSPSTNDFPFGQSAGPGTRYQQAFSSSNFAQPILISEVHFFLARPGTLRTQDFALSLSTTGIGIDLLSTFNFGSNVGTNNQLFASGTLSGAAPSVLSFAGQPFIYDPAAGNLLLDFQFSGIGAAGTAQYAARIDANGIFSRYSDFGSGNAGWGLITEIVFAPVPEPSSALTLALGLLCLAVLASRRAEA